MKLGFLDPSVPSPTIGQASFGADMNTIPREMMTLVYTLQIQENRLSRNFPPRSGAGTSGGSAGLQAREKLSLEEGALAPAQLRYHRVSEALSHARTSGGGAGLQAREKLSLEEGSSAPPQLRYHRVSEASHRR